MTKYVEQIVGLLSGLDIKQAESSLQKMSIDQIKVMRSRVLPQITDLERRKQLRSLLNEREQQIYASAEKDSVLKVAVQENTPISDSLKGIFDEITQNVILGFNSEVERTLLLERASYNELFVLEKKLSTMLHYDSARELYLSVQTEMAKRENDENINSVIWENELKERTINGNNLYWQGKLWQNLISHSNQIKAELYKPSVKTYEDSPKRVPGFWSRAGSWIADTANALGAGVLKVTAFVLGAIPYGIYKGVSLFKNAPPEPEVREKPPVIELNEDNKNHLDRLRLKGAQEVAKATGLTGFGGEKKRDKASVLTSLHSRFGMVIASQMMAGTKNSHHRDLNTVIESLTRSTDDNNIIEEVENAIKGVIDPFVENPLNGEHACSTGGDPDMVTSMERELFSKLVERPEEFEKYGVRLTKTEKAQVKKYYDTMKNTQDLSHILKAVGADWGGYRPTYPKKGEPKDSYVKVEHDFEKKQQEFENKLLLASRAVQEAIKNLKDGESLYLETGLEGHAMQLVIKKEGANIKLSTYDSSGALENTALAKGGLSVIKEGAKDFRDVFAKKGLWAGLGALASTISGVFKLWRMGEESMRRNALTFSVPQEKLYTSDGLDYLRTLIKSNSMAGWAETHIDLKIKHTTMEERSHMGYWEKLMALNAQSDVYSNYIKNFTSIASDDSPPEFQDLLQRPQNTQNCFAKKAQSCELYELGKPTYKKVRLAMMLDQRQGILDDVCGKEGVAQSDKATKLLSGSYAVALRKMALEPEILSPDELYEVSMRLSELKTPPTEEYYKSYFEALIKAKEQLIAQKKTSNQPAIDRINDKINSHAKEFYLYLKENKQQDRIEAIFDPAFYNKEPKDWPSDGMPLKTIEGKIDTDALTELSKHSNFLAWKATIQLMNHQIKKLSVNERHIHSEKERLSSTSRLSRVTTEDLIDANLVTFNSGESRKETIKIEINIDGKRKEIDINAYFKRLRADREALISPKVVDLLNYICNASTAYKETYIKQVYKHQIKAFEDKMTSSIDQTAKNLKETIDKLNQFNKKLDEKIDQSKKLIESVKKEIETEQKLIGDNKNSVKLRNLTARLDLLNKEVDELNALQRSIATKLQTLQIDEEVPGPKKNIATAKTLLAKLQELKTKVPPDLRTINAISKVFRTGDHVLDSVKKETEGAIREFEVDNIEEQANDRLNHVNKFRERVISNHLEANSEYRILDELASGRLGLEIDKNRDMYKQTPEERIEFYRQGKNTFLFGSVFQEIQSLNQKLKEKVFEIIEQKVILSTDEYSANTFDSIGTGNAEYIKLDTVAGSISKQPIPDAIKKEWVEKMFLIWLKHEHPEKLNKLQNTTNQVAAINNAFHHFLEQKANMKYGALMQSGYPINLNESQIKEMWQPIDIEAKRKERMDAGRVILSKLMQAGGLLDKIRAREKVKEPVVESVKLTPEELVGQHAKVDTVDYAPPEVEFLKLYQTTVIDGNTLKFLRANPTPKPKGRTEEDCTKYYKEVESHLHKLKTFGGLENKAQRITEFCNSATAEIFNLPYPPPRN
nr:hypothetical protein [Legionella pneumophila]